MAYALRRARGMRRLGSAIFAMPGLLSHLCAWDWLPPIVCFLILFTQRGVVIQNKYFLGLNNKTGWLFCV